VAVIGAGTMGHGIAHVAALAGYETRLYDLSQDLVDAALTKVRSNLDKGVDKGKVTPQQLGDTVRLLSGTTDLERATAGADIVIEAVPEKLELKHQVLQRAAASAKDRAILATNTSSLSLASIAAPLGDPARVIGLHFFNPVHINRLVEVVRGRQTADTAVQLALDFVARIGKEAVLVNDSPGFATSRLGVLLGLEAMRMVEEGVASAADIDKALELGYRHPMGPLRLTDLVGLDVRLDIASYLHEQLGAEHFRPPEILKRMVAEGKLGKKSGEGFYQW
jgi:3-hydroxybutyryl-CoA dehydrogenase